MPAVAGTHANVRASKNASWRLSRENFTPEIPYLKLTNLVWAIGAIDILDAHKDEYSPGVRNRALASSIILRFFRYSRYFLHFPMRIRCFLAG